MFFTTTKNIRFSLGVLMIFTLLSCTSTKIFVHNESYQRIYNGGNQTRDKYRQEVNDNMSVKNSLLERGSYPSIKKDYGEILGEIEDAVILQTIGSMKVTTELGMYMKSKPVSNTALLTNVYPESLKLDVELTDMGYDNRMKIANKINSYAAEKDKIDYDKGYVPILITSDFLLHPVGVDRVDGWMYPNKYYVEPKLTDNIICGYEQSINNGCITVVAVKKYNSIKLNSEVMYQLAQRVKEKYSLGYKNQTCNNLITQYTQLFSNEELIEMNRILNKEYQNGWPELAGYFPSLFELSTSNIISGLPFYYLEDNSHDSFIKYHTEIRNNYSSTKLWHNGTIDSIVLKRINFDKLKITIKSLTDTLKSDYVQITRLNSVLLEKLTSNTVSSELKSVVAEVDSKYKLCNASIRKIDLIRNLKNVVLSTTYREESIVKGANLHYRKLEKEFEDLEKSIKDNSDKYFKELNQSNEVANKINSFFKEKKEGLVREFVDKMIALPEGEILNFDPIKIDYTNNRTKKNTMITMNTRVIVKKVRNIDRTKMLCKVISMPLPKGYHPDDVVADYYLKPEAEVVLPFSEFQGYPGDSQSNLMNNFLNSLSR
jgi:hypothetical protein